MAGVPQMLGSTGRLVGRVQVGFNKGGQLGLVKGCKTVASCTPHDCSRSPRGRLHCPAFYVRTDWNIVTLQRSFLAG